MASTNHRTWHQPTTEHDINWPQNMAPTDHRTWHQLTTEHGTNWPQNMASTDHKTWHQLTTEHGTNWPQNMAPTDHRTWHQLTTEHGAEEVGRKVVMKVQHSGHAPEREVMQGPAQQQPPAHCEHPVLVLCSTKSSFFTVLCRIKLSFFTALCRIKLSFFTALCRIKLSFFTVLCRIKLSFFTALCRIKLSFFTVLCRTKSSFFMVLCRIKIIIFHCTLQDKIIMFHCSLQHKIIILYCTLQDKIIIFHCTLQDKIIICHCTLQDKNIILHCTLQDKIIIFHCTLQDKIIIFHCTLQDKIIICHSTLQDKIIFHCTLQHKIFMRSVSVCATVCVCASMCVCVIVCVPLCVCVCVCASMRTCMCVCVSACMHACLVSMDKILHFIATLIIIIITPVCGSHLIKPGAFWPVVSSWPRAQCSRWRRWPWGWPLPRTRLGCPASTPCGLCQRKSAPGTNHDHFHTAPFSALQLTSCALVVCDSKWVTFYNAFWISIILMYLQHCLFGCYMVDANWNCCCVSACFMYAIQPCTSLWSLHSKPHLCLFVTYHLHFWQNDQDLLRDNAEIHGRNGYPNESAQKVDPGEENSSTTPQTLDLSIIRLELHTSISAQWADKHGR